MKQKNALLLLLGSYVVQRATQQRYITKALRGVDNISAEGYSVDTVEWVRMHMHPDTDAKRGVVVALLKDQQLTYVRWVQHAAPGRVARSL